VIPGRIEEDIEGDLGGTSLQRGVEVQRAQPLPGRVTLLAGYRFKRVAVADFEPVDVAGLDFSLFRDTRDSALDARRGAFLSLNLQISPKKIGSDFDFLKDGAEVHKHKTDPLKRSLEILENP